MVSTTCGRTSVENAEEKSPVNGITSLRCRDQAERRDAVQDQAADESGTDNADRGKIGNRSIVDKDEECNDNRNTDHEEDRVPDHKIRR